MQTDSKKAGYPYPLHLGALQDFCHPRDGHVFYRPAWADGHALAANSYIALRVARGYWLEADFETASADFERRFNGLPWARLAGLPDDWRAFDEIRGQLYRDAPVHSWTAAGICAPSRVWRVNGSFLARLSHLQMLARLPRCEVYCGLTDADAPLMVRFAGGGGMLANDPKLTVASFSIFEPARHHSDGGRIEKIRGPCVLPRPRPYWADFE